MEGKTNSEAYMERNKVELFISMAYSEMRLFDYERSKDDDREWYKDEDIKWNIQSTKVEAYQKVRKLMKLNEEYEQFKIMCVDSQMSCMESCGKYDEDTIHNYIDEATWEDDYNYKHYETFYESSYFGQYWKIKEDIFKNGWSWTDLYQYCKPGATFKHKVAKKLWDRVRSEIERNAKLMLSYTSLEEAKKNIDPTEYHCEECGTTFYAEYRSKHSVAPRCPVCEIQDWMWLKNR